MHPRQECKKLYTIYNRDFWCKKLTYGHSNPAYGNLSRSINKARRETRVTSRVFLSSFDTAKSDVQPDDIQPDGSKKMYASKVSYCAVSRYGT